MGNPVKTRKTKERPPSAQMIAFAKAWVDCGVGAEAYRTAYPLSKINDSGASQEASRLLADPRVINIVQNLRKPAQDLASMTVAEWLAHEIKVGYTDATGISRLRVKCCRYCHGVDHKYQWKNMAEYLDALARAEREEAKRAKREPQGESAAMPTAEGGYGFRFNLAPHPNCPECLGEGTPEVRLTPTDQLTPDERMLIAGYKYGKHGIEVIMHNQDAARLNVGKALGALVDRTKHEGAVGVMAGVLQITPEQAAAIARDLQGSI